MDVTGTVLDYVDYFDIVRSEYKFIGENMLFIREDTRIGSFFN